jgi:hypothetical protein
MCQLAQKSAPPPVAYHVSRTLNHEQSSWIRKNVSGFRIHPSGEVSSGEIPLECRLNPESRIPMRESVCMYTCACIRVHV